MADIAGNASTPSASESFPSPVGEIVDLTAELRSSGAVATVPNSGTTTRTGPMQQNAAPTRPVFKMKRTGHTSFPPPQFINTKTKRFTAI